MDNFKGDRMDKNQNDGKPDRFHDMSQPDGNRPPQNNEAPAP